MDYNSSTLLVAAFVAIFAIILIAFLLFAIYIIVRKNTGVTRPFSFSEKPEEKDSSTDSTTITVEEYVRSLDIRGR